ncbi:MAG: hypothetical protein ACKVOQ_07930 [Cyclobacteriaceae bacterium]
MSGALVTILILASIILLPIIPSYLLFVGIRSFARVDGTFSLGPFKDIKYDFGGGAALYVFILIVTFFNNKEIYPQISKYLFKHEVWSVEGRINLEAANETIGVSDILPRVIPTNFEIAEGDKSFEMLVIVGKDEAGEPDFPKLQFECAGFLPSTVHLSEFAKAAEPSKSKIKIGPISLKKIVP